MERSDKVMVTLFAKLAKYYVLVSIDHSTRFIYYMLPLNIDIKLKYGTYSKWDPGFKNLTSEMM